MLLPISPLLVFALAAPVTHPPQPNASRRGEPGAKDSRSARELYYRPVHIGLFAISLTSGALTAIPGLYPRQPSWFTPGRFDRAARRKFKAPTAVGRVHKGAARASDVMVFAVAPLAVIGPEIAWATMRGTSASPRTRARYALQDLSIVGESFGLAFTTVNVLKISVARRRPFVTAGAASEPPVLTPYAEDKDQNASFPSGHSATAFALAVSGATVASMRRYSHWRLAWLALIPAATVPFLRVAADKHYLSDVLVGSAIGTAFGVAMPLLVHNDRRRRTKTSAATLVRLLPHPRGASLLVLW